MKKLAIVSLVATPLLAAVLVVGCEKTGFVDKPTEVQPAAEGAGCLDTLPSQFPYQPGCCEHAVGIPEVTESGWDTGTVGADPTPKNIHLSFVGPADTTFTVNWRTDPETTATQLLYGTDRAAVEAADGPSGDAVKRVTGHHMLYGSLLDATQSRVHEAHVCGLTASTAYFYKVGAPGAWSAVVETATAPVKGATEVIRFSVTGDSRDDVSIWAQVQKAVADQGVDLQVFTGDAVNIGVNQSEWNNFFEASTGDFRVEDGLSRAPFMVVNGNHDSLSVNFIAQFAVPQEVSDGETAQGEEWYSFDYGNAHFVMLNDTPQASALSQTQREWLEADLAAVDRSVTPWVFAAHHQPTYSCRGSHGSYLQLRTHWQPVFDQHQVDFVFSGHDHLYERSFPMRGLDGTNGVVAESGTDGVPVNQSGTVYVVTAGAGAELYTADDSCYHVVPGKSESVNNYVIVELEDRTLRLTTYRLNGSVLDQFEYTK
jgi:3',5'-cyclic AMP phosphodiesterase CpdA